MGNHSELTEYVNILFKKFHEVEKATIQDTAGRILSELTKETEYSIAAKFVVYKTLYELVKNKNDEKVKSLLIQSIEQLLKEIKEKEDELQRVKKGIQVFITCEKIL